MMHTISYIARWVLLLFALSTVFPCVSDANNSTINLKSFAISVIMGLIAIDMLISLFVRKKHKILLVMEMTLYFLCGIILITRLILSRAFLSLTARDVISVGGGNLLPIFLLFWVIILGSLILVFLDNFLAWYAEKEKRQCVDRS